MSGNAQLNPSQLEAVTTTGGPVLVIAGAGSGKTRIIEYRVAHLVKGGVDPSSILLLTFTRKAAIQMLSRASKHHILCNDVHGGTFHSFSNSMLRVYAKVLDFHEGFTIIDRDDSEDAITKCLTELGFSERKERFLQSKTLVEIISACFNKGTGAREILERDYPPFVHHSDDIEMLRRRYAEYKINLNYVDYDDLLLYLKLLLEHETVGKRIANRYHHIMVDEYQDTNKVQGEIVYLLAQAHHNVMVVGDDAQSIYGFRGASHQNIMGFPDLYPGCTIIKLEENYRSTQTILNVGNAVMEGMTHKYSKQLIAAQQTSGQQPSLHRFVDATDEANWVADRIKTLRDEGFPLAYQAALFRSTRTSIPLQVALKNRNIPYLVVGGSSFQKAVHVKDVVAHLRILSNPRDELAWIRVLKLIEGIGPVKAAKITALLTKRPITPMFEAQPTSSISPQLLGQALRAYVGESFNGDSPLRNLSSTLEKATITTLSPGDRFDIILGYYEPLLKAKFDNWHRRLEDLVMLRRIAGTYQSLEQLITDFTLEPFDETARAGPMTPQEQPVTLSTIHSAKGLEWDAVFLPGLVDGLFPSSFALRSKDEMDDELRLFYVAVTRAKKHLYLSYHHGALRDDGKRHLNTATRFLTATVQATLHDHPLPPQPAQLVPGAYTKTSLLNAVIAAPNEQRNKRELYTQLFAEAFEKNHKLVIGYANTSWTVEIIGYRGYLMRALCLPQGEVKTFIIHAIESIQLLPQKEELPEKTQNVELPTPALEYALPLEPTSTPAPAVEQQNGAETAAQNTNTHTLVFGKLVPDVPTTFIRASDLANQKTAEGWTPLMIAAMWSRRPGVLYSLMAQDVDKIRDINQSQKTALDYVVRNPWLRTSPVVQTLRTVMGNESLMDPESDDGF